MNKERLEQDYRVESNGNGYRRRRWTGRPKLLEFWSPGHLQVDLFSLRLLEGRGRGQYGDSASLCMEHRQRAELASFSMRPSWGQQETTSLVSALAEPALARPTSKY